MDNVKGRWALVTGASSGLGIEFATLLAQRSANLVLAARRTAPMEAHAERLRQLGVQVVVEGIDLAVAGAGEALKARLDQREIAVDVLINNAGYGLYGDFVDEPLPETLEMLRLNVLEMTALTHVFAADMVARRRGHVLLIASLLAYQAVPGYAAYAASKGYVLLFGEALHAELSPHGVGVTVLCPGATSTAFASVASQKDTLALRLLMMEPHRVARTGILAMLGRRSSVVAGIRNKLVVLASRFMPRLVQRRVMQAVMSGH
jgi:uncharacterized protein